MVQVAIVGAGFAGMALSIFLKRHGISSSIYESRDQKYTSGGNIALAPNTLRVLDHAGVFDRIRRQGYNYESIAFTSAEGTVLGHFLNGSQSKYNFAAIRIHRTIVRDALREAVKEQDIPIFYNKKCTGVSDDNDNSAKVTITFEDGENVTADYVIGADGIHSKIRSHLAPSAAEPSFSGLVGIMGTVMANEVDHVEHSFDLPAMLFGDNGSFAIMPANYSGSEVGYFATLELEDRSRDEWAATGEDKEGLKRLLTDRFLLPKKWPRLVQELVSKTPPETLTCWPFFSAPHLDSWVSKSSRVVLIGDSAHAIPPTGGQGAAMALEDAETLAYALAMIFETATGGSPPQQERGRYAQLLDKWNYHRHERIAKVLDFTSKNGSLRKSSPHFYEHVAKEWIIWAAFKWMGPEGGARWMYEYAAENVRSEFV